MTVTQLEHSLHLHSFIRNGCGKQIVYLYAHTQKYIGSMGCARTHKTKTQPASLEATKLYITMPQDTVRCSLGYHGVPAAEQGDCNTSLQIAAGNSTGRAPACSFRAHRKSPLGRPDLLTQVRRVNAVL